MTCRKWRNKSREKVHIKLASALYNLLLLLVLPGAFFYYLWRIFVSRKSNLSWRENLGYYPKLADRKPERKLVWIHAASVGEVIASLSMQDELRKKKPDVMILLTTITQTGNSVARKSAKKADIIAFFPLDYPFIVKKALNLVKPDVFVMVEAEIWPNFLANAKKMNVSTILVNGKMSDKSFRRSRHWKWLLKWAISNIDYCAMQTKIDAERIKILGAKPETVHVVGNMKFDQEGSQLLDGAVKALRAELGLEEGVPVIVAGSTNPGEDEPVLKAFLKVRRSFPNMKLIIAPRQLERADEIAMLVEENGLTYALRSNKEKPYGKYDVMILDVFGELGKVYSVGVAAFVGGTLIPKGGHSIIQPILQGKPVFFGPYTFKTRDIAEMAISAGVGFQVGDENDLAESMIKVISNPSMLAEIERSCKRLVMDNKGASARCADVIVKMISEHGRD